MHYLIRLSFIALTSLLIACSSEEQSPQQLSFSGPVMGTSYSVKYILPQTLQVTQTHLREGVEQRLARVNLLMSTYREDSELNRFNAAPVGEWFALAPETYDVLDLAQEISRDTDGALDVTVAALVELWGFGAAAGTDQVPDAALIKELVEQVGHGKLELRPEPVSARKLADIQLDLSAIAKGYAVDYAADFLRDVGVHNFMLELGGEIYASGTKPGNKPWRIAIESPVPERRDIQKILDLTNVAVATSGDYRNFFERDGKRYSHTIDPRTGYTIDHMLASVTVLDAETARADGLATAFMVMGEERALEFCALHNIPAFFIIKSDQGFVERSSLAFQQAYH